MKHIELFESFNPVGWVNDKIDKARVSFICKKYDIENWSISKDGLLDVDGDVKLACLRLSEIPIKFGHVSGNFHIQDNRLTSLEGAPISVSGSFVSNRNRLRTLNGSPKNIGYNFQCTDNNLTTLEGGPESVGRSYYCHGNDLVSLLGAPERVFDFGFNANKIVTLEGLPKIITGLFQCNNNPIYQIYKFFPNQKSFIDSLDWNYIRKKGEIETELLLGFQFTLSVGQIIKSRFSEACEEAGIKVPERISGYEYI